MRNFCLAEKGKACIMTGRTISYLLTDNDVYDSFYSINNCLDYAGIFCFDCIDAGKFISQVKNGKRIVHKAEFANRKFQRDSYWSVDEDHERSFRWKSVFYEEKENDHPEKIGEDDSVLRTFNKQEMTLFLQQTGFEVKEIIDRPSYAFDTFVIVSRKIN
jgi:hypothetical protein